MVALQFIILSTAFKSMRQRVSESPVSLSVPEGSLTQDDILTRDLELARPLGQPTEFSTSSTVAHTNTCTHTHTHKSVYERTDVSIQACAHAYRNRWRVQIQQKQCILTLLFQHTEFWLEIYIHLSLIHFIGYTFFFSEMSFFAGGECLFIPVKENWVSL